MKISYVFWLNTIVALIFGLAFVLVPGPTTDLYDVNLGDGGMFIGRLFGAALLAFCALTWLVKDAGMSDERQAILLALFIGDAVGFVASLIAQVSGVANGLGWSTVAIYLILAVAFGYYRFMAGEATA